MKVVPSIGQTAGGDQGEVFRLKVLDDVGHRRLEQVDPHVPGQGHWGVDEDNVMFKVRQHLSGAASRNSRFFGNTRYGI